EAPEHREPCAGELARAVKIEDAESLAELPVCLRLEVEARLFAPDTDHGVVVRATAGWNGRVRQVRYREKEPLHLAFLGAELRFELRNPGADGLQILAASLERGAVRFHEARHVLVRGVAPRLEGLDFDDHLATRRRESRDRIEAARSLGRAAGEGCLD